MMHRRCIAMLAVTPLFTIAGCTRPAEPEMHSHMHGGTAEAGATFVPGADLSLASLPAASGSTVLDVTDGDVIRLDPVMVRNRITGTDILQYAYNGQLPGPTIRVRQGSTFTVNVVNGIDRPTTIHWHGIRIENRFDGVPGVTQDPIEPGGTFSYTVTVPDAGLFWYHPHVREDLQQDLGLYGNLLVLPTDDPAPTDPPIILALDDILLDDAGNLRPYGSKSEIFSMMGRFGNTHLVNGSENPVLTVPAGTQRLYLTNVANTRTYRLAIDGATMRLVGGDIGFGTPRDIDELILGPAERAIVDVTFPAPGSYALLHRSGASTVTLTTLLAQNDAPAPATPRPAEDIPDTSSFRAAVPDKTLRISFQGTMMHTMTRDPDGIEWEDGMAMHNAQSNHDNTHWRLVDDETGKINMDILWRFKTGDLVKIRIKNDAESMQHPIHFHGQRFLVLTRNDLPVDDRQWKDTTLVRAGETVDLLLETSNPGRWMFHCHIAEHLQNGMMGEFIVE